MNQFAESSTLPHTATRTETFWLRIQSEIGQVAEHLQNILNFQQLAATAALGNVTDNDIMLIEADMRNAVQRVQRMAAQTNKEMKDYYGSYEEEPAEFRFTIGDIRVIQTIIESVKRIGIHNLLATQSSGPQRPQQAVTLQDAGHSEEEEWKAASDASQRSSQYSVVQHQIIETLDRRQQQFEIGNGGKIIAKVLCPMCGRSMKLIRDPPRSWPTFNIMRHFNRHLCPDSNKGIARKKAKKSTEMSTLEVHDAALHPSQFLSMVTLTTSRVEQINVVDNSMQCSNAISSIPNQENDVDEEPGSSLNPPDNLEPSPGSEEPIEDPLEQVEHRINLYPTRDEVKCENDQSLLAKADSATPFTINEREDQHGSEEPIEDPLEQVASRINLYPTRNEVKCENDQSLLAKADSATPYTINEREDQHESSGDGSFNNGVARIVHLSIEPANLDNSSTFLDKFEDSTNETVYSMLNLSDPNHNGNTANSTSPTVEHDCIQSSSRSTPMISMNNSNDSLFLKTLNDLHERSKKSDIHGQRYHDLEKDICAFEYLTAGNAHYDYFHSNLGIMSKKTIQRHIKCNTIHINEGTVDAEGLKAYLVKNGFSLNVVLCEDATKITATAEYDHTTDSITGLVAPLDATGLPQQGLFRASTPYKMANDLKAFPTGNYAYVQVAIPMTREAAPYVLYHACSDNKFEYKDVMNRWDYTESLLQRYGITVMANASDGDSRLMKAMRNRAGFDRPCVPSPWGPWFRVDYRGTAPINVQDTIHTINKFRNRMLKGDMIIGKCTITKQHLKDLVTSHSKDKHGLSMSDVELKDKMKFGPTLKFINPDLIEYLKLNVPNSRGTVEFLNLMRCMYEAFIEPGIPMLDRIKNIWTTTFIVRGWRNHCKSEYNNLTQCITTNAYHCLELNAHALILFICMCRDKNIPEQCIIEFLSSQPCEELFRELRSMSTTNQTVVNFSIKELTEKLKRIYMKRCIMYKHRHQINFPFVNSRQQNQSCLLPSNEDIVSTIEKSKITAQKTLLDLGIEPSLINICDSVLNHCNVQEMEFFDINLDECIDEQRDITQSTLLNDQEEITCNNHDSAELVCECNTTTVYEAAELFGECGELKLKSSVSGNKHTFKISDSSGQIKNVKKSTLLWMITEGRHRLSTDRMRRFQQN